MKFVNYGMPTGLGIKEFNTKTHKYSNVNGITNNENILENEKKHKDIFEKIQFGGGHSNEPCETVFYIIDRPITSEPEVENVELTDDEELSEEIELSKTEQYESSEIDENGNQSKLIGETDTSSESSIKSNLRNAIDVMVQNNKKEESNPSNKHNKIRSLKGLFSQNKNDGASQDTSHDTSHDTLRSILRVLNNSKNAT
jgi:hypothetical protein